MASYIYRYATKDLAIHTAKEFIDAIRASDGRDTKNSAILYACIGRTEDWDLEPNVDELENDLQTMQFEPHRKAIGGKKIAPEDVSHVTHRYDWTSGKSYKMYRDTDKNLCSCEYFVVTPENNVYKCLYNNKNAVSTIMPTGFSTIPFTTSDGYTWKYMYTISLGDARKFMTTAYIPVRTLDDLTLTGTAEYSRQVAVQNTAVNGAIEVIELNSGGVNYRQLYGAPVGAANSTHIGISPSGIGVNASTINGDYNGMSVYVIGGTGAGQLRRIVGYNGTSKTLEANTPFNPACNVDSTIVISPTVTIIGDGKGAQAYSRVNASGSISNVAIIHTGSGYTRAKALISTNTLYGYGASANVIISPPGGHGSDPVRELAADKVMLNVQFEGSEGQANTGRGYIPSNTVFRTLTVVKDPILKVDANNNFIATEVVANTSNSPETLRLTTRLHISYDSLWPSGRPKNEFLVGETITNERLQLRAGARKLEFTTELSQSNLTDPYWQVDEAVQAANGNVVYIKKDAGDTGNFLYHLYINNVDGYADYQPFIDNDNLIKRGDPTIVANVLDVIGPEANTYSGKIIYHENLPVIHRDPDQIEDFKIILDF